MDFLSRVHARTSTAITPHILRTYCCWYPYNSLVYQFLAGTLFSSMRSEEPHGLTYGNTKVMPLQKSNCCLYKRVLGQTSS